LDLFKKISLPLLSCQWVSPPDLSTCPEPCTV